MNDMVDFAIGVGAGLGGGGGFVWFVMRGQAMHGAATIKAETRTMIAEATSALKNENATDRKAEREAFLHDARREVGSVLDPVKTDLSRLQTIVHDVEKDQVAAYASLITSIGQINERNKDLNEATNRMSAQTSALVGALKNSQVRGRWGEIQLRRVVELAGMKENCDFEEQSSAHASEGRPDMNVHLPGNRVVFVDAKAPLAAYLEMDAETDERRKAEFRRDHARAVRFHVEALAKRNYHASERSIGFTVMFVPGESFLQAAMMESPDLMEMAAERDIYLCGPMTLLPLLRSYAVGWREIRQEQRAKEIAKLGADLHDRLKVFAKHFAGIGTALEQTIARYNDATGSFQSRVLPQGRRMQEAAALPGDEIGAPETIDSIPRRLNGPGRMPLPMNGTDGSPVPLPLIED